MTESVRNKKINNGLSENLYDIFVLFQKNFSFFVCVLLNVFIQEKRNTQHGQDRN